MTGRSGKYALELDHMHVGWLASAEGGYLDVDPWIRRKEGAFGLHPGSHRRFWEWIEGSPYGERSDGAIIVFDAEGREIERLVFAGARASELGLPALDAARANAGALSLRLQIKAAEIRAGGQASAEARGDAMMIAGCRLQLAGAGASTHRVDKIAALAINTQPGRSPHTALQRVVLDMDADLMWDEALVGRQGSLEYFAADPSAVLARLEFRIAGVRAETIEAAGERAGRMRVELACRELQFALEPAIALESVDESMSPGVVAAK